ncbi:MAG TPA: dehydrogenase [Caldithrix abyssi]|uniref:Dehydrogenase n=1 Tax=Caldithrix abyssi TaxID=187145 RepID=A0A7V4WWF7_CALAY|nr:dehydrogenase [Caldithrix abyssi]
MKQLIQHFRTGQLELVTTVHPMVSSQTLIVAARRSLISVGTEKMLLDFGKASYISKAKQQPDRLKEVFDKIKTEGFIDTAQKVWNKINEPIPLGYSHVGVIIEKGNRVDQFEVGQRVVSNGPHAEIVQVPWTLAAPVPDSVSDDEAAFTVPGSICLEGIRLLNPTIGETFVVIGLGLLGQITTQILQANGCRVIAFDLVKEKVDLARAQGVEAVLSRTSKENIEYVMGLTNGMGTDGVIITASTTSEQLLSECALISRKRGRIVLVGVVPITVPRNLFYEKELSFQVSSAYGPGRYDPTYESGQDYPFPYVRWTAKRNMEAFLFLLEQKKIHVSHLITDRFPFEQVLDAYELIDKENPVGILLEYSVKGKEESTVQIIAESSLKHVESDKLKLGFIGAGNFAKAVLLPALQKLNAPLEMISSSNGLSANLAARKFKIARATSDRATILKDESINAVFIVTRHNTHAALVAEALQNDKHVFVEKPLALTLDELKTVYKALQNNPNRQLMVGFNRRFAPFVQELKNILIDRSDPVSVLMTINAGNIPMDHWVHDPVMGGGRIIGEACHFIDLARFLTGSAIRGVSAVTTNGHSGNDEDKTMILLTFSDGSQAAIHYLANGNSRFPKERIEVFSSQRIFQIDNFKKLKGFGSPLKKYAITQDKGHLSELKAFLDSVTGKTDTPIPAEEIFEVHLATLAVLQSITERQFISMESMWKNLRDSS